MLSFFKRNSILFTNSIILLGLFVGIANIDKLKLLTKKENTTTTPVINTPNQNKVPNVDSTPIPDTIKTVEKITTPSTPTKVNTTTKTPSRNINDDDDDSELDD